MDKGKEAEGQSERQLRNAGAFRYDFVHRKALRCPPFNVRWNIGSMRFCRAKELISGYDIGAISPQ